MPGATNYRQDRILAAVGPDGALLRSNGDYAEWDEDALASLEDAIALKANANNPVFTGTVTVPDGALAIADTNGLQATLDAKASTALVDLKAPIASPTFTGTVTLPAVTQSGNITANAVVITPTELGYVGTLTSDAQTQINAKANSASPTLSNPTFTGTVTVPDGALAQADVSGLVSALAAKADESGGLFTGLTKVTADGDPTFVVETSGGTDLFYVTPTYNGVHVANGGEFSTINGAPGVGAKTFVVNGANGDTEIDGSLNHDGTTVGFFGATPVTQPAANPDTSGATLPNLEIEVNQIKALLRSLGLMAT